MLKQTAGAPIGAMLKQTAEAPREDLMVKFVAGECVLEHFRSLWTQTVLHVCNAANVYRPEDYSLTAIGQSLDAAQVAPRHLLLPRIERDVHLVTLRELCVKVPFQVYVIEISPKVIEISRCTSITISDSEDEAAGAALPRSRRVKQVARLNFAAQGGLRRLRSPSPQHAPASPQAKRRRSPSSQVQQSPQAKRRRSPSSQVQQSPQAKRRRSPSPLQHSPHAVPRDSLSPMKVSRRAPVSPPHFCSLCEGFKDCPRASADPSSYATFGLQQHRDMQSFFGLSPSPSRALASPQRAPWAHRSPLKDREPWAQPPSRSPPILSRSPSAGPAVPFMDSPTYSPTYRPPTPSYQPTSPSFGFPDADKGGSDRASSEIYVCEGNCGFEGQRVEVEEHEYSCEAFKNKDVWWCEYACFFQGDYDTVQLHEATCALRPAAVPQLKKHKPKASKARAAAKTKKAPPPAKSSPSPPPPPAVLAPKATLSGSLPKSVCFIPKKGCLVRQRAQKRLPQRPPPDASPSPPPPPAVLSPVPVVRHADELALLNSTDERRKLLESMQAHNTELMQMLQDHTPKFYRSPGKPYDEVLFGTDEWNELTQEFDASARLFPDGHHYSVHRIYRIQSDSQNRAFQARRLMLRNDNPQPLARFRAYDFPNEVARVWHGTNRDTVPKIVKTGMDRSASGGNGAALGSGIYFSPTVQLPLDGECGNRHRYCPPDNGGYKHLILAAVILGHIVVGDPGMKVFPQGVQSTVESLDSFTKICSHADDNHLPLYHFVIDNMKDNAHLEVSNPKK